MADELEKVPGRWFIEYGEIRNYRNFADFKMINNNGDEVKIKYDPEMCIAANHYFEIWDNCREFGLPNNGDWSKNPGWLVDMIKNLNRIYQEIENYRTQRANWKGGK